MRLGTKSIFPGLSVYLQACDTPSQIMMEKAKDLQKRHQGNVTSEGQGSPARPLDPGCLRIQELTVAAPSLRQPLSRGTTSEALPAKALVLPGPRKKKAAKRKRKGLMTCGVLRGQLSVHEKMK